MGLGKITAVGREELKAVSNTEIVFPERKERVAPKIRILAEVQFAHVRCGLQFNLYTSREECH